MTEKTRSLSAVKTGIEKIRFLEGELGEHSGHGRMWAIESFRRMALSPKEPVPVRRRALLALEHAGADDIGVYIYVGRFSGEPSLERAVVAHLHRRAELAGPETAAAILAGVNRWLENGPVVEGLTDLGKVLEQKLPHRETSPAQKPWLNPNRNHALHIV